MFGVLPGFDQAIRPAGLAGTMAVAMNTAETAKAKTAAKALLAKGAVIFMGLNSFL